MITYNNTYKNAKDIQTAFSTKLKTQIDTESLIIEGVAFEDSMNGLSGEIQNLSPAELLEIQEKNSELVAEANTSRNLVVSLHDSVLAKIDRIVKTEVTTVLAKKLYPRTESVWVVSAPSEATPQVTTEVVPQVTTEDSTETEEIDPIFDEIDVEAEAAIDSYTPIAKEQNETLDYLPSGMIVIAQEAAANANGLQAGLTAFSYNPISDIIDETTELLLYYTENNYANLNVALSGLYSDPAVNTEYKAFQASIAGNDGLSGSISQLSSFKDHTDRLSGLVLESTSPNAESSDDTTVDNLALNDYSGGPTLLFSFDSRKFRSAKYMIQASADITDRGHQTTEIYVLHDNHHAYTHEVTSIYSQDPFVTFTTRLLNKNVEILVTTTASNTNFVIYGTRLKIAKDSISYPEMSQQIIIQMHENLSAILDDGVDYVNLMSASVLKPYLVGNLAREFRDFLVNLAAPSFIAQSTGTKAAALNAATSVMTSLRQQIQEAIDLDWDNFVTSRKLMESLDIAYNLTVAYTDSSGNSIPSATLNTRTITAIEDSE